MDPNTVPGHIAYYKGTAVEMSQEWVDKLMRRPGDTDVLEEHVKDLLNPVQQIISKNTYETLYGFIVERCS